MRIDSNRFGLVAVAFLGGVMLAESALATETFLKVTTFEYDAKMNLTKTYSAPVGGGSNVSGTAMEYDILGRETFVRRFSNAQLNDANGADEISLYVYDVVGNLSRLVRKGPGSTQSHAIEGDKDAEIVYTYDSLSRKTSETRWVKIWKEAETNFEYDKNSNITKQKVRPDESTFLTTVMYYDMLNRVTRTDDPEGNSRRSTYDALSRAKQRTRLNPSGTLMLERELIFYDNANRVATTVGRANPAYAGTSYDVFSDRVVSYVYDLDGRAVTQLNYKDGNSTPRFTLSEYDGIGRLTKTIDPAGFHQTLVYDAAGRVTERRHYDGVNTRTFVQVFDDLGQLKYDVRVAASPSNNITTEYGYDVAGQLTRTVDPTARESSFAYNTLGRQTMRVEDTTGIARTTSYQYDPLGRLVTLTAHDNHPPLQLQHTTYSYDAQSGTFPATLVTYPPDPGGDRKSYYFHDLAGRLTGSHQQYSANEADKVFYRYDKRGLLTSRSSYMASTSTDGDYSTFAYDNLGRMTKATAFEPDLDYNPIEAAETTFTYSALSCMVKEVQELFDSGPANAKTLAYVYDQQCNRQSLDYQYIYNTFPLDDMRLAYEYDVLSRNTKIRGNFHLWSGGGWRDFVRYDFQGNNLTRRRMPTTYAYEASYGGFQYTPPEIYLDYLPQYDEHDRITRITNRTFQEGALHNGGLNVLARYDYSFDAGGNRLSAIGERGPINVPYTDPPPAGYEKIPRVPNYSYDGLHRLTSAAYDQSGVTQAELFTYDPLGNRLTYADERSSSTTTYTHWPQNDYDQLTSGGVTKQLQYWANAGNLLRDEQGLYYAYDSQNRLRSVYSGSDDVASFSYDALGRMIKSTTRFDGATANQTQTLYYYYDGSEVIAEYDAINADTGVQRRYIHGRHGVDERAMVYPGTNYGYLNKRTFYYLLRELDTVTGLVAANGALAEGYAYDAYGKVRIYSFRPMDYDKDGDQDGSGLGSDYERFWEDFLGTSIVPTASPQSDQSHWAPGYDGHVEVEDYITFLNYYGFGLQELRVSGLGNPYFFTGRRLHFLDTSLADATPTFNRQLQHNRARHYDPQLGRWLQRDPDGYVNGTNLYEYVRSNPTRYRDPTGRDLNKTAPEAVAGSGKGRPTNLDAAGPCDCACIVELAKGNPLGLWMGGFKHYSVLVQDCKCKTRTLEAAPRAHSVTEVVSWDTGEVIGTETVSMETITSSAPAGLGTGTFDRRLLKTPNCGTCKNLIALAGAWNDKAHAYFPLGPNSNSFVGLLLREAGLPSARPNSWDAIGWDDLFGYYPPYRIGSYQPDFVQHTVLSRRGIP